MLESYQHLSMEELVDILAQKTGRVTQLMAEKNFNEEYKENKNAIQEILAEIKLRKEASIKGDQQSTQQTSIS